MSPKFFIDRPIFASCISVLMVLLGFVSMMVLPIEQYPSIAPPTVVVSATYNGASAATVQKSVIVPLEEAINGVEDMLYMTSTATNAGSATIQVFFKQGIDSDMAAVNVQNRVAKVQSTLPSEVTKYGVTTEKQQSGQLKIICMYSTNPSYDETVFANLLTDYSQSIQSMMNSPESLLSYNIQSRQLIHVYNIENFMALNHLSSNFLHNNPLKGVYPILVLLF